MTVTVSAPGRLHFGLFSVGQRVERQFGGMGLMVNAPPTIINATLAERFSVHGDSAEESRRAIESWFQHLDRETLDNLFAAFPQIIREQPSCEQLPIQIEVVETPPRHSGLGSGTQLALCSAAAAIQLLHLPMPSPEELAIAVGRGLRSAIGSYGFFQGGLLVDRGKTETESLAPLDFRTDFPEDWPILIVLQKDAAGLSGDSELDAFREIPDSTIAQKEEMVAVVRDTVLPAVMSRDYDAFGDSIYQFGRLSGMYFKTVQGGPYAGRTVTDLVQSIRDLGVPAVGQTSWGPGVFAICRDLNSTDRLQREIENRFPDQFEIRVTSADNRGFEIQP
jgi:beta-ribofuranosylaminobenzene 5'-phosphate synthase